MDRSLPDRSVAVGKTIQPVIRAQDTPAPQKPIALIAPRDAPTRKLARNAYGLESSSPDGLAKFLKADTEKWESVIKTTGLKID